MERRRLLRGVPILGLAAMLVAAAGCSARSEPGETRSLMNYAEGRVEIVSGIDTVRLRVEIAETERQREVGLSGRQHLDENSGMIFVFPDDQPPSRGFWMFRTPIPLSIAFLDADGIIRSLRRMEPCASRFALFCRRYPAGVSFRAALEAHPDFFYRNGISIGDRAILHRE